MKPSRALALYGIALDELVDAIRAGDVITRRRWRNQEPIHPRSWRSPPKPLENLDEEVDIDRESLDERFGDAAKAAADHRNAGRKPGGLSRGPAIIQAFLRMVEKNAVSLNDRGRQAVARKLQVEFPDYKVKYIAELIAPEYRRLKNKRS
jgi:hypothetical protein